MRFHVFPLLFTLGLAAVITVGMGYAVSNPWVLGICALIALVYFAGGVGLWRYRKATATLQRALQGLTQPPAQWDDWLVTLDESLRTAVRLRVLGERVALPAPTLPAYLSGVLVLLGMLGTLLGMMTALQGTGMALETASDLQAVRDSLAAPVRGLGYAFGTSIAGIAASAALGLLVALCRRERLEVARLLDAAIVGPLHGFTRDHRQEDSWQQLRQQSALLPTLVERLQAMAQAIEQRDTVAQQQLLAQQADFHARTETAYTQLATAVERSLQSSIAEGALAASRALAPVAQASMAGLNEAAQGLHQSLLQLQQSQLDAQQTQLRGATAQIAGQWEQALADQRQAGAALLAQAQGALSQWEARLSVQSQRLLDELGSRLQQVATANADAWAFAQSQQQTMQMGWATAQQAAQSQLLAEFAETSQTLLSDLRTAQQTQQHTWDQRETQRQAAWQNSQQTLQEAMRAEWQHIAAGTQAQQAALVEQWLQVGAGAVEQQKALREEWRQVGADAVTQQFALHEQWQQLAAVAEGQQAALREQWLQLETSNQSRQIALQDMWQQLGASVVEQQAALRAEWQQVGEGLQRQQAALQQDAQQLQAALAGQHTALCEEWRHAGEQATQRQQQVCDVLERNAEAVAAQARTQTDATLQEVGKLMQAASEAPRVAAEVIGQLRQALSDSLLRDTAMQEERGQLLTQQADLLAAVQQATHEQHSLIDTLMERSTALLERVGAGFDARVDDETRKLDQAATRATAGALELASMGDAFAAAVDAFAVVSTQLAERLERLEGTLEKSIARSDEQLAYYIAQAREVVDLSLLSQRQLVADLAVARGAGGAPA